MRPTRSSYNSLPRASSSSMNAMSRPPNSTSMLSGIKSIFCSKSHYSQPSHAYPRGPPERPFSAGPVRIARAKTSDLPPVISPQLEDRLLQLADRSRRLGVHRFSRTRNALVLNEPVVETRPVPKRLCPPSASSLSTRSSVAQLRE